MFKDYENCGTKTEEVTVQHVNQSTKLNPFGHLSSTSTKPVTSYQSISTGDDENSLMRENSKEEITMFQENQNYSTEIEATNAQLANNINGDEAIGDIPVASGQPMSACGEESENSLMRENSTGATVNEQKLYNKINNRVKNFANDNKKRVVKLWYWIGEDIDKYYEGDYGKSEMKRISDNTRIGMSTLYKAVQFANKFTADDLKLLLEKDYIAFRLIVESFPIGRDQALQVFETSSNAKEAQQKINEIKCRESGKGTTPDVGTDSKSTGSEMVPDTGDAADTVHEETGAVTQPADQVSSHTEPQSPYNQAEVAQTEGLQDGKGTSVTEQPSSDKKTSNNKDQNTEAVNLQEVSGPCISCSEESLNSPSYLFETMNKIGTKLINTSVEKPANGDVRKIILDTMMDLSNLLTLVPETNSIHSWVTLSEGAAWESSCQSVALQV